MLHFKDADSFLKKRFPNMFRPSSAAKLSSVGGGAPSGIGGGEEDDGDEEDERGSSSKKQRIDSPAVTVTKLFKKAAKYAELSAVLDNLSSFKIEEVDKDWGAEKWTSYYDSTSGMLLSGMDLLKSSLHIVAQISVATIPPEVVTFVNAVGSIKYSLPDFQEAKKNRGKASSAAEGMNVTWKSLTAAQVKALKKYKVEAEAIIANLKPWMEKIVMSDDVVL